VGPLEQRNADTAMHELLNIMGPRLRDSVVHLGIRFANPKNDELTSCKRIDANRHVLLPRSRSLEERAMLVGESLD